MKRSYEVQRDYNNRQILYIDLNCDEINLPTLTSYLEETFATTYSEAEDIMTLGIIESKIDYTDCFYDSEPGTRLFFKIYLDQCKYLREFLDDV